MRSLEEGGDSLETSILSDVVRLKTSHLFPEIEALKPFSSYFYGAFMQEVQQFTALTERPTIKSYLEKSGEPYRELFHILFMKFMKKGEFPIFAHLTQSGLISLSTASSCHFPEDVEKEILEAPLSPLSPVQQVPQALSKKSRKFSIVL